MKTWIIENKIETTFLSVRCRYQDEHTGSCVPICKTKGHLDLSGKAMTLYFNYVFFSFLPG